MKHLKMCLNWRVAMGLGALAGALYLVAPGLALAALPLLILALCPLSMIAMMFLMGRGMGMRHGDEHQHAHSSPSDAPEGNDPGPVGRAAVPAAAATGRSASDGDQERLPIR